MAYKNEIIDDLCNLIRIDSVKSDAQSHMPYGKKVFEALMYMLNLAESLDLLSNFLLTSLIGRMGNDVVSHVLIGQACIGFLVGVGLDLASGDCEGGVVPTHTLKLSVFSTCGVLALLSKGGGHDDLVVSKIDVQCVLHFFILQFRCCFVY